MLWLVESRPKMGNDDQNLAPDHRRRHSARWLALNLFCTARVAASVSPLPLRTFSKRQMAGRHFRNAFWGRIHRRMPPHNHAGRTCTGRVSLREARPKMGRFTGGCELRPRRNAGSRSGQAEERAPVHKLLAFGPADILPSGTSNSLAERPDFYDLLFSRSSRLVNRLIRVWEDELAPKRSRAAVVKIRAVAASRRRCS